MCVQYIGGIPWVHWGDIMSTLGGVQYIGGYHDACGGYHEYIGGYHEYIGGCSVHRGDIMIHVGEQVGKILSISIENPDVLNILRCTEIPDVLMISPRCTHGIPPMYSWYPPDVLMVSLHMHHDIPWCTEHPPVYSWYPPMYPWYPPNVFMVSPRCTEHPPTYWTHIIQGEGR